MTSLSVLLWRPGEIAIDALEDGSVRRLWERRMPRMTAKRAPGLALTGVEGGLVVRAGFGERSPFALIEPAGASIERVPGEGPLHPSRCRAHPSGVMTAIDGTRWVRSTEARPNVVLLKRPGSEWNRQRLPRGFVGFDCIPEDDGLIVAGSRLIDVDDLTGGTEAAIVRVSSAGDRFVPVEFSFKQRARLRLTGGLGSFTDVDGPDPIVARAAADWPLLSETVVVVGRGFEPGSSAAVFRREGIVSVLVSAGGVSLVTSPGSIHTKAAGDRWTSRSLPDGSQELLAGAAQVTGAIGSPSDLIVAVTAFGPGADPLDAKVEPAGCKIARLRPDGIERLAEIRGYAAAGLVPGLVSPGARSPIAEAGAI